MLEVNSNSSNNNQQQLNSLIYVPQVATPQNKKRKNDDLSRVKLTRENSLKISSLDYEAYISNIAQQEPLSNAEQKAMKKQRRSIKNREYAQNSRNKKKEQFSKLAQDVTQLQEHNAQLSYRIIQLEEENSRLREENRQFCELYNMPLRNQFEVVNPSPPSLEATLPNTSSPGSTTASEENPGYSPVSDEIFNSIFSSDEEQLFDEPKTYPFLSGFSSHFDSINFGIMKTNMAIPQQVTTLFVISLFMIALPFISIGLSQTEPSTIPITQNSPVVNPNNLNDKNYYSEDSIEYHTKFDPNKPTPCVPRRRILYDTQLNTPWPKQKFEDSYPKPAITMKDVYRDEQVSTIRAEQQGVSARNYTTNILVKKSHGVAKNNSSEGVFVKSYLSTPKILSV